MRAGQTWLRMPGFWTGCFVALGLGLRAFHYLRDPSVWHDEAALLVNVLGKGFGELLGPLALAEAAPPLFLWVERAVSLLFGEGTFALRLVPFLASCLALLLLVPVAQRLLRPGAVPWVVLLAASSNRLLWHSCEAKPYAVDVLAAVALPVLFAGSLSWPLGRRLALFGALAPVIIFFSYPGCFLYGGLLAALFPEAWRQRAWAGYLGLGAVVGASFLLLLFGPARAQRCELMAQCWTGQFPDWGRWWGVPGWALCSSLDVVRYCFEPGGHVLALVAVVGAVSLWCNGGRVWVALLALPIGLALVASLLGGYPYGGARVEVFALPGLALLVGAGVPSVFGWLQARGRFGALALAGLMLTGPAWAVYRVVEPWSRADCGGAYTYVLEKRQPGETVTANHWEYLYYFRNLGADFVPLDDVTATGGTRRWLVLTRPNERDCRQLVRFFAATDWRILERREFKLTRVYLLERREENPAGRSMEEAGAAW